MHGRTHLYIDGWDCTVAASHRAACMVAVKGTQEVSVHRATQGRHPWLNMLVSTTAATENEGYMVYTRSIVSALTLVVQLSSMLAKSEQPRDRSVTGALSIIWPLVRQGVGGICLRQVRTGTMHGALCRTPEC